MWYVLATQRAITAVAGGCEQRAVSSISHFQWETTTTMMTGRRVDGTTRVHDTHETS